MPSTSFSTACPGHFPWVPPTAHDLAGAQLSAHAWSQMGRRKVSPKQVQAVLLWGRKLHLRGAAHFVVGHREVQAFAKRCPGLAELEGLVVVCDPAVRVVVTVYRRRDLHCLKGRDRRPWAR